MDQSLSPNTSEMNPRLKGFLSPEWLWRLATLGVLLASLYFQVHFVSRDEYVKDQAQIRNSLESLHEKMNDFKLSVTILEHNAKQLDDHESRIRTLERITMSPPGKILAP